MADSLLARLARYRNKADVPWGLIDEAINEIKALRSRLDFINDLTAKAKELNDVAV